MNNRCNKPMKLLRFNILQKNAQRCRPGTDLKQTPFVAPLSDGSEPAVCDESRHYKLSKSGKHFGATSTSIPANAKLGTNFHCAGGSAVLMKSNWPGK